MIIRPVICSLSSLLPTDLRSWRSLSQVMTPSDWEEEDLLLAMVSPDASLTHLTHLSWLQPDSHLRCFQFYVCVNTQAMCNLIETFNKSEDVKNCIHESLSLKRPEFGEGKELFSSLEETWGSPQQPLIYRKLATTHAGIGIITRSLCLFMGQGLLHRIEEVPSSWAPRII